MTDATIIDYALKALLYEVSATPKPGLVDRAGSGAHTDMDFYTFIDSTLSLRTYFETLVDFINNSYENHRLETFIEASIIFKAIKPIGICAEEKMRTATKGVNTHKGAIFALGLLVTATSEVSRIKECTIEEITKRVSEYMASSINDEFALHKDDDTYGVKQYETLGLLGARGEAYSGFSSATRFGLPILETCLVKGMSFNDAMIHALLNIMVHLEDSNVIGRTNLETLRISQDKASKCIDLEGLNTVKGRHAIEIYAQWCVENRISHGGAADLMAVSVYLYFIKEGRLKK